VIDGSSGVGSSALQLADTWISGLPPPVLCLPDCHCGEWGGGKGRQVMPTVQSGTCATRTENRFLCHVRRNNNQSTIVFHSLLEV